MGPDLSQIQALRDQQQAQAKQFRANQPGMQEDQDRTNRVQARNQLAGSMANVGKNYNARGLLYSGLRSRDNMGAAAQAASGLESAKAQTASDLEQTGREYENNALQSGLTVQGMQQDAADQAYQSALQARQAKLGAVNSVFGAGGTILGSMLGRR